MSETEVAVDRCHAPRARTRDHQPQRLGPDGYGLDNYYLARPGADEIQLDRFLDYASNVAAYPAFQEYFRAIPEADIRFVDSGHFALETHAGEIAAAIGEFLRPARDRGGFAAVRSRPPASGAVSLRIPGGGFAHDHEAMSLSFDVFIVDPKPIPSAVPGFEAAVGQATWPPTTSTLLADDDGALLVDCLITEREARELAAWVKSHGTEPGYVYITHPHADHFLGLPEILAAFPDAKPVALAETISAMEEQVSPGYMQVWGGFFPGQLTSQPVVPAPLAGATVPIGGSQARVIRWEPPTPDTRRLCTCPAWTWSSPVTLSTTRPTCGSCAPLRTPAPAGYGHWMPWPRSSRKRSWLATATRWPAMTMRAARSASAAGISPTSRPRWKAARPRPSSSTG